MQVVGFQKSNFTPKDSNREIRGYNLFLSRPLVGDDADGIAVERCYITDEKLAASNYTPCIGDEVDLFYNRFGKPDTIRKVRE